MERIIEFTNSNPTEAEKLMYKYGNLYLVEENEDYAKYAPVLYGKNEDFPTVLKAPERFIERKETITFWKMAELVKIESNDFYDYELLTAFAERLKEIKNIERKTIISVNVC